MRHTLLTNFRVPAEPKCEVKPFPFEFVTAAATTAVNVAPSIFLLKSYYYMYMYMTRAALGGCTEGALALHNFTENGTKGPFSRKRFMNLAKVHP